MNVRVCLACGEPLLSSARIDKTTCGPACRARLCRSRNVAGNASVTPLSATTPRSGHRTNARPPEGQTGPPGASWGAITAAPEPTVSESPTGPGPCHADPLVLALARYVEALHDRYLDGPDQMRAEALDSRANMPRMCKSGRGRAA
jgi:hypothetical protein